MAFGHGRRALDIGDDRLIERPARRRRLSWNEVLVWFMRLTAALWIAKGLVSWAAILGIGHAGPAFEARAAGWQAATIYFAVIDIVAAIGLWLTSTWGGVLWLLAVMSHLILAVFFPRYVSNGSLLIGLLIMSLMIYLITSWLAALEE